MAFSESPSNSRPSSRMLPCARELPVHRLPDNGQRLSRLHAKRDSVYRGKQPGRRFKAHFEVLCFQQCHSSPFYTRSCGGHTRMMGQRKVLAPHAELYPIDGTAEPVNPAHSARGWPVKG